MGDYSDGEKREQVGRCNYMFSKYYIFSKTEYFLKNQKIQYFFLSN